MSSQDVAYDDKNPLSNENYGCLYNWPGGASCASAINPDYTGEDVNANNFINVLKGDEDRASGPVLKTDENSTIFIFYSGEGKDDGA